MSDTAVDDASVGDATSGRARQEEERSAGAGRLLRPLRARWHLALSYFLIIWVTLGVLLLFLSRSLGASSVDSRRSYLYAQAHLISSVVRSRGGPGWGVLQQAGGVPARGRVLLVDGGGKALDDSAGDPDFLGKDLSEIPEVKGALGGRQTSDTYYLPDWVFVMYLAVPASWGGAVFISQDLSDIVAQYRSVMGAVITGGAVASFVALSAAWGLANLVFAPVQELARTARRMASGRLDLRVKPRGPVETRELGDSFNYMAKSIQRAFARQEEFLAAAAHELRSPLSAMSALVESMEVATPGHHELPGLLTDLGGELRRVIATTEELLALLRVSGDRIDVSFLDPTEAVREVVASRDKAAQEKGVSLRFSGAGVRSISNGAILRLIAANLVDNGIKFTGRGGEVRVVVEARGRDLVLRVEDTGVGILPDEIPKIFRRFYRTDGARQKSTGGAGLGLAIVKEACDRTGATVEVASVPRKGSSFVVTWPGVVAEPVEEGQ